jgi:hypothetical protein
MIFIYAITWLQIYVQLFGCAILSEKKIVFRGGRALQTAWQAR